MMSGWLCIVIDSISSANTKNFVLYIDNIQKVYTIKFLSLM